jgi:hypothetical protein
MPSLTTVCLLINIACESFFGAWLLVSPATVPDFPGAPLSSDGALTSRRMYGSAILALSAAATVSRSSGQCAPALLGFCVLHASLVATFLLSKPAGTAERIGTGLHLALAAMSLVAYRSSVSVASDKKARK